MMWRKLPKKGLNNGGGGCVKRGPPKISSGDIEEGPAGKIFKKGYNLKREGRGGGTENLFLLTKRVMGG